MRSRAFTVAAIGAGLVLPGAADAAGTGTLEAIPLPTAANSVAAAPDGAVWVTLPSRQTVARVAVDGTVTESGALGGAPVGIAIAGGKAWATIPSTRRVAIVDLAAPSSVTLASTPAASCGPAGVTDGGNGSVYVSLPNDGSSTPTCPVDTPSAITSFSLAGAPGPRITNRGTAFDLVATPGSLWIPDFTGDQVRRVALDAGLSPQTTHPVPATAGADGITVAPNGDVVTSLFNAARLGRIPANTPSGAPVTVFGPSLVSPFGIAHVGGSLYAAASAGGGIGASIARVLPDFTLGGSAVPPGPTQPWDVAAGPDGSVVVTDLESPRLLRFTSRPPRVTTGASLEANTIFARVALTTNPGGNQATASVEYGTTTAYGSTAPAGTATGTADVATSATLTGLQFGTTYHYRAVVTTAEGTAFGEDRVLATAVPPGGGSRGETPGAINPPGAKVPTLAAKVRFTSSTKKGLTRIAKIRVSALTGGESIKVTCAGKGCPKKSKPVTVKVKKAGTQTVPAPKVTAARLGKGAKVTVQVTKPGAIGVVGTLTAQGTKKPKNATRCLLPGATKSTVC